MDSNEDEKVKKHYRQLTEAIIDITRAVQNSPVKKPEGTLTYTSGNLVWGDKKIEIETGTREDFICQYMFKSPINSVISWDEIYEEMEGMNGKLLDVNKWREIYDSKEGVNKKCLQVFGVKIFKWKNKALERLY